MDEFVGDNVGGFHLGVHGEGDVGVAVVNADAAAAGLGAFGVVMGDVMVVVVFFAEDEEEFVQGAAWPGDRAEAVANGADGAANIIEEPKGLVG